MIELFLYTKMAVKITDSWHRIVDLIWFCLWNNSQAQSMVTIVIFDSAFFVGMRPWDCFLQYTTIITSFFSFLSIVYRT